MNTINITITSDFFPICCLYDRIYIWYIGMVFFDEVNYEPYIVAVYVKMFLMNITTATAHLQEPSKTSLYLTTPEHWTIYNNLCDH